MKKSIKSLISLLTIAMMLIAFAPGTLAKIPNALVPATISLFGNTSLAEGKTTEILKDNDFFVLGDIYKKVSNTYKNYVYDYTEEVPRSGAPVNTNLDHVVAFNAVNSGIDFRKKEY